MIIGFPLGAPFLHQHAYPALPTLPSQFFFPNKQRLQVCRVALETFSPYCTTPLPSELTDDNSSKCISIIEVIKKFISICISNFNKATTSKLK